MSRNTALYKISSSVIICLIIGFLCTLAIQGNANNWLKIISKPSYFIPTVFYYIVWGINFGILGLSAGIVWSKGFHHSWVKTALYHFGFQLLLTAIWFILFFEMKQLMIGFLLLSSLFIFLLFTIKWFNVVSKWSAILLIPYTIWIAYNAILNFEIWRIN
jgi:tryptophan-rich sensory protein